MTLSVSEPRGHVTVPFVDLEHTLGDGIREAIQADLDELLRTHAYTNGPQVRQFEEAFARFVGTSDCVGMASGHDALRLTLLAMGIEPGDEVIVPAHTFVATFEAVDQAGGIPVPAEISAADYNLDPAAVESAVGPRTRFLLPVHLYGTPADLRALGTIADRHGLEVLEDACQAHGAARDGVRSGAGGRAAAFSFYPSKNLGAIGDAGAVTTNDAALAERLRMLRVHGERGKYSHELVGFTARLDTIQAVSLLRKLPHLDRWNDARREVAAYYTEALDGVGDLVLPRVPEATVPVWHLFVVRTPSRDALASHLEVRGISTGRHYPQPPHLSPAFAHLGHARGAFPLAEQLADEGLSLPIYPGMRDEQLEAVVAGIRAFYASA
jgi:dTDP-4-amino-4,6-dideoxygalactose transaminase